MTRACAISTCLLLAVLTLLTAASTASADRFVLVDGGEIEGELLNRQQTPRTSYAIRTDSGITLTLPAGRVAEVTRQKDAEAEYARRAPGYADTVDGQWKLAVWCGQQQLKAQRETHLRRILELSPDHIEARHALGYVQLQGKWTTQRDHLSERGYQLYKGQWRSPQDIALIESRESAKQAARDWLARLKGWRAQLNEPRTAASAYQRIAEVRDEAAVGPLRMMMTSERSRDVKSLYIEVLCAIGNAEAIESLVFVTLNDPDLETFYQCADELLKLKTPNLQKPYLDALKNDNNVRINRAAYMLGRIDDPSTIGPLIDVLITTHTVVISSGGRGGESVSTSFSNDGGNSFQTGEAKHTFHETVHNREVLEALTRLARGQTFGYDLPAWKRWHAAELARGGDVKLK